MKKLKKYDLKGGIRRGYERLLEVWLVAGYTVVVLLLVFFFVS